MRNPPLLRRMILLFAVACALSACGGTSTKVTKTLHDRDYKGGRFNNVLVIAVGRDYDKRAQFEREVVAGIRRNGAEATAYYTIAGNNTPITTEQIKNTVQSGKFDAVLFTRVKSAAETIDIKDGSASAKSSVKGGNLIDLFRYDYEELDEPENVTLGVKVTLISELYAAQDQRKIWSIESSSGSSDSVGRVLDSESAAIVGRLRKDKLIGPK